MWSGDQQMGSNYLALISNNWQAGLPSQLRGPAARWLRLPALKEGRPCPQGGWCRQGQGDQGHPDGFRNLASHHGPGASCRIHKDFIQKMGDSGNHERPDLVTSFSVFFFFLLLGLIIKMFMHMPVFPNACLVCSVSTYTRSNC